MAAYKTSFACSCSSIAAASEQNPGWTGDVCITALRLAVSHRKRSAGGSAAIVFWSLPSPSQIFWKARRCLSNSLISSSPTNAAHRLSSNVNCICKNRCPRQYSTTPTLINSSRSTRGTRRTMAYSNKSFPCILSLVYKHT